MNRQTIYGILILITLISWSYAITDVSSIRDIYVSENIYEDNVKGSMVPSGAIVLFDAACPIGWTCVSCNSGDDFYQRFPNGSASYGTTGGSATHTHTISGTTGSEASHTHGSGTYGTVDHAHGAGTMGMAHVHNVDIALKVSEEGGGSKKRGTGTFRAVKGHTHDFNPTNSDTEGASTSTFGGTTENTGGGYITGTSGTGSSHSHGAGTYSLNSKSTLPSYVNLVFCIKD